MTKEEKYNLMKHLEKKLIPDFNLQKLKKIPIDIRLNKLIDLTELIYNKAFCCCHPLFYIQAHEILEDIDSCNPKEREMTE